MSEEINNNEKTFEFFDFDNGATMNFSLINLLEGEETEGLEIKLNFKIEKIKATIAQRRAGQTYSSS